MAFSRIKHNFVVKTQQIVAELQPRLSGNVAGTENLFKLRVAQLIKDMNGEIVSEVRINSDGKRFNFLQVKFADGAKANMPTKRTLRRPADENVHAAELKQTLASL